MKLNSNKQNKKKSLTRIMVLQLLQGHFWNAGCLAYNNTLLYSSWALVSEKIEGRRRKMYSSCISKSGLGG